MLKIFNMIKDSRKKKQINFMTKRKLWYWNGLFIINLFYFKKCLITFEGTCIYILIYLWEFRKFFGHEFILFMFIYDKIK